MGQRRNPNLRSSIYKGADGYWHGRVTVGVRDDGKPDRRHVMSRSKATVVDKVRKLEKGREAGSVKRAGQRWRVSDWLNHWMDHIARPPRITVNTHDGYRTNVERHLIPGVGAHWLDKLEPEHLERLYAKMQDAGLSAGTAHYVHRTIRAALNEAVRRGHLVRNPAVMAKAPSVSEEEVEPYEVRDVQRLLEAADPHRTSARWAVALALGLRQGEALGLKWDDIDLEKGTLRIRRNLLRPKYEHGCGRSCGRPAGRCPKRINTRPATGDVKSKAGRRIVGLPEPLVALLRKHHAEQDAERLLAGRQWQDEGWVFATPTGGPANHYTDHREWKRLLRASGLREARLHDARHTAATVLLILGQPERTVMSLMGWSSTGMTKRYQHVTDTVRSAAAAQVGSLIWDVHVPDATSEVVTVRRDSLAVVLQALEEGLINLNGVNLDPAGFQAALTDVQAAMGAQAPDSIGGAK